VELHTHNVAGGDVLAAHIVAWATAPYRAAADAVHLDVHVGRLAQIWEVAAPERSRGAVFGVRAACRLYTTRATGRTGQTQGGDGIAIARGASFPGGGGGVCAAVIPKLHTPIMIGEKPSLVPVDQSRGRMAAYVVPVHLL
jgi:hypothetical protein